MIIWIVVTTISILIFSSMYEYTSAKKEFSTCYDHFGCVNFTCDWFDDILRPKNLPPLERHIVNTKFLLLQASPNAQTICYDVITANPVDIRSANYDPNNALMLLIHDFTSNGYTGWIKHLAREVSALDRYNVISVDWQEGAEPPFLQAISNARIVAIETEGLISTLAKHFNLVEPEVHIIGHGVGAHIAGYVGKNLHGRIGRITGLDPTGPCFEGMPAVVRLDHNDAMYVEVIHTDGEGHNRQGTMQPLGNMDFYFNTGASQPGCRHRRASFDLLDVTRDSIREGMVLPDCSHKRAFHYYIEAVRARDCTFLATPHNLTSNETLDCLRPNAPCASIGLEIDTKRYADEVNAKYDVNTTEGLPYCSNKYRVSVKFYPCCEAEEETVGYFNLLLFDEQGTSLNLTTSAKTVVMGKKQKFEAISSDPVMEKMIRVTATWHFTAPFCWRCRNTTCVHKMTVRYIRAYNVYRGVPPINSFCPRRGNYVVLYDHVPSCALVECNNCNKIP